MTVVAFRPRVEPPKDRRYKVLLHKDGAKLLCEIRPAGPEQWQCWIRLNGRETLARCTDEASLLDRIAAFMAVLVQGLKADGWSEAL